MNTIGKSNPENLQSDVVVIGGGGSGLVAAVAAAEAGVKDVIVLEKSSKPGGNTFLAIGMIAIESPLQKQAGIKKTKDDLFKEAMAYARWTVDPQVVRAYVDKSGELIGWLLDKGLKFEIMDFGPGAPGLPDISHGFSTRQEGYTGNDPSTGPGFVGSTVVNAMLRECEKLGIKILYKTAAKKVITDGKGKVTGVLAEEEDEELRITAKSVIIAAGGFGGNKEMIEKYFQITGDVCSNSLDYMTGDGIIMAEEAGAAIDEDYAILSFGPCHHPWAYSLHELVGRPDILMVNRNGERFMDEAIHHKIEALNKQPGAICYALLDSKIREHIQQTAPAELERIMTGQGVLLETFSEDLQREGAEGKKVKIADSWDEIADWIGARREVLKATVEQYNSFCAKGYDAEFIKDQQYLRPLSTPPFYAVLGRGGYDTTFGGIKINNLMEVIDKEGKKISGLYASGDNTGRWVSQNYAHGGTALTFAFCSGHIAGDNAAKYALGIE